MDINKAEKIFCEGISIGHSQEYFVMVMNPTSVHPGVYALTPEHLKKLSQYIETQLKEFETKYNRKIEAVWSPGIQSPLQMDDLKDKGDQDKKKRS